MNTMRTIVIASTLAAVLIAAYYANVANDWAEEPSHPIDTLEAETSHDLPAKLPTPQSIQQEHPSRSSEALRSVWTAYQTGDYAKAMLLAERHLQSNLSDNDRIWIQRQIPIIKVTLAWQYIQTSQCQDALELLGTITDPSLSERLLVSDETRLTAEKGAAICYFKSHRYIEAEQLARNYARLHPGDRDVAYVMSQSLEANQKFDEAMRVIESFLDSNPALNEGEKAEWQDKLKGLEVKKSEASIQTQIVSQHINLFYDPKRHDRIAGQAIDVLEESIEEFHALFGLPVPSERLNVHLYSPQSFQSISHGPNWAQGIFDGHIRIPIHARTAENYQAFYKILRHELVHALLSYAGQKRNIPSWFNEGLAIFLECRQGCRGSKRPDLYQSKFLSLKEFESSFLTLSERQALQAYGQSLYLIQSLVEKHGLHVIHTIIENLPSTGPLNSNAILQSIEMDFSSLHTLASQRWQNP